MNYQFVKNLLLENLNTCRRKKWDECKRIRLATESDVDYIPNINLKGLIVEDCIILCDCKIRIYIPSQDDLDSKDWEIMTN
jgi:hypothetical protein